MIYLTLKELGFLKCEGSMIYHNLNILNKRFVAIKPCNRCTFSMYVTFYIENCEASSQQVDV